MGDNSGAAGARVAVHVVRRGVQRLHDPRGPGTEVSLNGPDVFVGVKLEPPWTDGIEAAAGDEVMYDVGL
jgi:hypothetical protein